MSLKARTVHNPQGFHRKQFFHSCVGCGLFVPQYPGSNSLLELSKLCVCVCVWMWAFAGTLGPEPGQVPTQILRPFKRTPAYFHSCLEDFYKWPPQTSVLGSCFRMCASVIQPSLSRVGSCGSGKNLCPLNAIVYSERYCFIWVVLESFPTLWKVCPHLGLFCLIHTNLNMSWDEMESGWFWDEEVLLLQVVKPTGHIAAWPLHLSTEMKVPLSCVTEGAATITSSKMPSLSEKLPHFCTSWWAGPLLFHPCSYFPLSHA